MRWAAPEGADMHALCKDERRAWRQGRRPEMQQGSAACTRGDIEAFLRRGWGITAAGEGMGIKTAAPWNLSTARLFLAVLKKGAGSAFQNVAQKDVRHDQAARHMERPFERAAFARRLGGLAVPAQITVPFAADVVRKTGFAVLRRFEKPFRYFSSFVSR